MEKRHEKRVKSRHECELISRSLILTGIIEEFSEDGIRVEISTTKTVEDIAYGMLFVVKFQIPSGDMIDLQCRAKHACRTSPSGPTNNVGMEIIDQPQEYEAFLKTLK